MGQDHRSLVSDTSMRASATAARIGLSEKWRHMQIMEMCRADRQTGEIDEGKKQPGDAPPQLRGCEKL